MNRTEPTMAGETTNANITLSMVSFKNGFREGKRTAGESMRLCNIVTAWLY